MGDAGATLEAKEELRLAMSRYANLYYLLTSKQLFFEKHFRDPVRLSYYLADLMELENDDKQALLEAPDAATRSRTCASAQRLRCTISITAAGAPAP